MIVLGAVRGVEPEYIDAGGEQLAQNTGRVGGRSQSGDNFCIGHPLELSCQTGRGLRGAGGQSRDFLLNRVEPGMRVIGGGRELLDSGLERRHALVPGEMTPIGVGLGEGFWAESVAQNSRRANNRISYRGISGGPAAHPSCARMAGETTTSGPNFLRPQRRAPAVPALRAGWRAGSEEHTSELQS